MATRYPTNVELDPTNDSTGYNRVVLYNSASAKFELVQKVPSSSVADCSVLARIQAAGGTSNYGRLLFSTSADGTCENIYGTAQIYLLGNNGGGFDGANGQEFRLKANTTLYALSTEVPIRIDSGSSTAQENINSYEWVASKYINPANTAGVVELYEIKIPYATSYTSVDYPLSGSTSYVQIKHSSTIPNSGGNLRHQASTITIMWARGNLGAAADDPIVNAVEDLRYPEEKVIYDPSSFSAEWTLEGNLLLSVYQYDLDDDVRHMARFITVGTPGAGF